MLYLVSLVGVNQDTGELVSLIKVGKTQDLEHRVLAYRTHNPLVKWVGFQKGYTKAENKMHSRLERLGCQYYMQDFIDDDESIHTEWMTLPEDITVQDLATKLRFFR